MYHSDLRTNLNTDTMKPSPFAVQALASKAIWLKSNQNENPQTNNVLHHPHLKTLGMAEQPRVAVVTGTN